MLNDPVCRDRRKLDEMTDFDEIGVVAIGRNEGQRLINCLSSLRSCTSNVVYVDSGSTDGSVAAAEGLGAHVVALDPKVPFTAARARNAGFAALTQMRQPIRFVQFVDGDCTLAKDWLERSLTFLKEHPDVAVVCGRRRELYPLNSIYNRLADREWNTPIGESIACGGDALMRVEAFESVGGFRASLIAGEEPELCLRLREIGWKIWRIDAEMTRHDMAMTRFSQWWARMVRTGYGMTEVCIWARQPSSTLFWSVGLPAIIIIASFYHPAFLLITLVYPLQVLRIAIKRRASEPTDTIAYALLTVIGKFAACQGLLRFVWHTVRGGSGRLIEYK